MTLTQEQIEHLKIKNLTPREIVSELDRYVIGQDEAKRAVAIALRNRWRRLNVQDEIRDDITPKNIIMIGPTGVGKTEIARRLAKLANSPFFKVEASKFTEVGYVGKDVESMIRDLVEISINMVRDAERERVHVRSEELAEEKLLDLLLPPRPKKASPQPPPGGFDLNQPLDAFQNADEKPNEENTRAKLRELLRAGKLNDRKVELDISPRPHQHFGGGLPMVEVISAGGSMEDISNNIRDMIGNFMPSGRKKKKVPVPEALKLLAEEEAARLIDMDHVTKMAIDLAENNGIIFIDEIDKIASSGGAGQGRGEVSREGVQRDILPIIEGSTVSTKYGFVRTDHMLFIAAGAFHMTKPSDLIPELQGRFPIRVELKPLKKGDFLRILTEPESSLTKQYLALLKTEGVELEFKPDSLEELAKICADANEQMENIGARRLHTILEKVMDEIAFTASERSGEKFTIDGKYVRDCLMDIIKDQDLRRFIL